MSTDQKLKPPASPEPTPPPARRIDLSFTKIVAGALAAMTAAALGSRLSVAGTVIGAALASIIAAVASALYTASLAHTQAKVKTVFTGRAGGADVPTTVEVVGNHDTRMGTAAPAQPSAPELDGHWQLPTTGTSTVKPARKLDWKSVVIAALATFAIAAATLTTFELVSGHALSGGDGTTITQVGSGNTGTTKTKSETPTPTPSSTSGSPEPSASATEEPTQEPSTAPEPSTQPSTSATSAPTPSATQAPSASSSAPTPAPSAGTGGGAGAGGSAGADAGEGAGK